MGEDADKIQAVRETRLRNVQHMVGPEPFGKLQAIIGAIDSNDVASPQHARLHQEAHAQRAHAQDHDRVVEEKSFTGENRHLLGAVETHGDSHDLSENGNLGRQIVWNPNQKASRNNVHILRPAAKQVGRIGGTQVVAVVGHVLAEVVGEVVAAVVTVAAGDIGADDDPVANRQGKTFEIGVEAVAS